jgi:2-phospho-L-lactate guanylyltransferase
LTRATQVVVATWNARGVLVVASDIPLLRAQDIREMLAMATVPPTVVLATDRRQNGTNIMLVRPAGLIPYSYGPGSFQRHLEAAQQLGVDPQVYESPTVALDVDVPADLELYRQMLVERDLSEPAWLGSD